MFLTLAIVTLGLTAEIRS